MGQRVLADPPGCDSACRRGLPSLAKESPCADFADHARVSGATGLLLQVGPYADFTVRAGHAAGQTHLSWKHGTRSRERIEKGRLVS